MYRGRVGGRQLPKHAENELNQDDEEAPQVDGYDDDYKGKKQGQYVIIPCPSWCVCFPRQGFTFSSKLYWWLLSYARRLRHRRLVTGFLFLSFFWFMSAMAKSQRSRRRPPPDIQFPLSIHIASRSRAEFPSFSTFDPVSWPKATFHGYAYESLQGGSLASFREGRMIKSYDEAVYNTDRRKFLDEIDDSDYHLERYYHEDELDHSDCRRPSWHDDYFPTCNNFHEVDLSRSSRDVDPNYDVAMLGHGYFRDVWRVSNDLSTSFALKTTRYRHEPDAEFLFMMRRDALVMTMLKSSPRINNIYGACAGSIAVAEAKRQILDTWIPSFKATDYGPLPSNDVKTLEKSDRLLPQNRLTLTEKIESAVTIAEAVADLHGYEGGVIVHDDFMVDQWLEGHDGQLILSDFNRVFFLGWDVEKDSYCKVPYGRSGNHYVAPEVQLAIPNDEKINVYSYGGHIYALLTGLRTYYADDTSGAKHKIRHNIWPYVDDRWRNRSHAESEMVKIMERCWAFDPDKRPDIFEVVRMIRDVRDRYLQEQAV